MKINKDEESLELTDEMLERNNEIDHAIYECVLILAEKDSNSLERDAHIIGEVTEAVIATLHGLGIEVRHPGVVTDEDGSQFYSDSD